MSADIIQFPGTEEEPGIKTFTIDELANAWAKDLESQYVATVDNNGKATKKLQINREELSRRLQAIFHSGMMHATNLINEHQGTNITINISSDSEIPPTVED